MSTTDTPLSGPPPTEVPLKNAPLVRVIAQVRFPLIASVGQADFIAPFQEAIRREYPVLRPEQSHGVVLNGQVIVETRNSRVWRFHDVTGAWRVSLSSDFMALETTDYSSRDDFLERLERVLTALHEHLDLRVIDRLGVRYIDRVVGDANLADLSVLIRPEVLGVLGSPLCGQVRHAISENLFELIEQPGKLMARWGSVPAGGTVDPAAVDAINEASWLLDLDAFNAGTRVLDVRGAVLEARGLTERIYSFFRWTVSDEFLRRYGGES